ncbi:hypothetical protein SIAM614_29286 [Stappia aggregata IAM 12614]|uniref:Uncharacterized protein n=1 Tax=Roseibium aggregatum (strain ATCC 25650 / DSM 13394 / JCM 20685 / NBRC 16684 / NCIMB 2208 / IAM 12614 / B1) TaxID=384765 RepID=A0P177_ROSAI|nr:hypothetical protein [Roseibium aggregatum]EAV41262.1 hypothetical protein SIAM614_29286 [Stappia aggregata IAM 12614] [Roseibium aggregatum IAM 12614]
MAELAVHLVSTTLGKRPGQKETEDGQNGETRGNAEYKSWSDRQHPTQVNAEAETTHGNNKQGPRKI